jgi:DeoR family transcriptional regulator of aga operon
LTTDATDLIPAERQARVLEMVQRDGAISIQRLAAAINVSVSTARRDLDFLTERGYLERTHGGAQLRARLRTTFEPAPDIAARVALPAKIAIGRHAASLIEQGQSVIFDSSSTVLEAARTAANLDLSITAVTNDLRIAMALSGLRRIDLVVPGGQVRPGSFTLAGGTAQRFIEGLRVDVAFIGIHSLAGLRPSDTSMEIALVKRSLIGAAQRVILLADATKFAHPAFCEVCPMRDIHEVVTDDAIADTDRDALERLGTLVTVVRVPPT